METIRKKMRSNAFRLSIFRFILKYHWLTGLFLFLDSVLANQSIEESISDLVTEVDRLGRDFESNYHQLKSMNHDKN
jgi:hypothetical protein